MKFDYTNALNAIRGLFSRRHTMLPIESVWTAVLIAFTVANILMLIWSFILFVRVSGDDAFGVVSEESAAVETLSRNQLNTLLDSLETRAFELEVRTGIFPAADVSDVE